MSHTILGIHLNMVLHLTVLSLPMLLAQLIIATFFASGFVSYYQKLYVYSFRTADVQRWRQIGGRMLLMVMSIGTGMIFHLMGYVKGPDSMMFHNVGLFLLIFPLLDTGINKSEVALRIIGMLSVWLMHYMGTYETTRFWIAVAFLVVGVVVMRRFRSRIRESFVESVILFTALAVVFWSFLPPFSAPGDRAMIAIQAIFMFGCMAGISALLWIRQHHESVKNIKMQQLANYDQLTNAKTYSLYQHDITEMFDEARENGEPLTLIGLDIDHFKQINDHYGHLAGNAILIGVATSLSEVLGKYGDAHRIYRTGGEEFNITFPNQTPEEVLPVAKECWETIRKQHFSYGDYDVAITISIGMTAMRDTDRTIEDTYKRADDNLYLSKRAGRDTITVEGETLHQRSNHDLLATYAFFTQGIADVSTPEHHRYRNELLLRMFDHEHDRWILPALFDISVDTQIDLMKKALASSHIDKLSINLTQGQFEDEAVAKSLTNFQASGEGPAELTVEITDVPDVVTMRRITAIYRLGGIRVEIDDVGSDNSFEVVRGLLPYVNGVKFAMQNLRKGNDADQMQERVRFWLNIAKENNLMFILEGVENADEVAWAHDELGINLLQGYYFNKPELPVL